MNNCIMISKQTICISVVFVSTNTFKIGIFKCALYLWRHNLKTDFLKLSKPEISLQDVLPYIYTEVMNGTHFLILQNLQKWHPISFAHVSFICHFYGTSKKWELPIPNKGKYIYSNHFTSPTHLD